MFGLTGNIGCGKSTVAALLSKHPDVVILNCDDIAKEIIYTGEYSTEVRKIFGKAVFITEKEGCIIHQQIPVLSVLAREIFSDVEKKRKFEELIHPLVWKIVQERAALFGKQKICVIESAIIYETKSEDKFAAVIAVTCNPDEQFRRLRDNRKMSDVEIQARLAQQLPSLEKERRACFVIDTDCSTEELFKRVDCLYQKLKGVSV
jgi:dephospho-CoA kinase